MKVLHVITDLALGGAETVLFRLVSAVNVDVTHRVVSLHTRGIYGPKLEAVGVHVDALEMPRGRVTGRGIRRLRAIVREFEPDVVQTHLYHADLVGSFAARTAGQAPVVWGVHSTELGSLRATWKTRIVRRLCAVLSHSVPSAIVCAAEGTARLHARFGYDREKLAVIQIGVDLAQFRPDETERARVRTEWGVRPDEMTLGLLARWHPLKDHSTLLQALAIVAKSASRFRCILAGNGMTMENTALMDLIQGNGVADRVLLLGVRSDVSAVMNGIDIHVLSSHSECSPLVVIEAMACGTPCVVTDVGDAALIVGDTGWIVPARAPEALAAGIESAMASIATHGKSSLGRQSRARIEAHYSLKTMAGAYTALWNRVVS